MVTKVLLLTLHFLLSQGLCALPFLLWFDPSKHLLFTILNVKFDVRFNLEMSSIHTQNGVKIIAKAR